MNPAPSLDVLARLASAASHGPWHIFSDDTATGGLDRVWANDGDELAIVFGSGDLSSGPDDNAAFIAAFDPPMALYLIGVAKAAQEAVDAAGDHNWPVNCDRLRMALDIGKEPDDLTRSEP